MVTVVGEPNVLRDTAVSPSASAASDYTSALLLRGGTSGETLAAGQGTVLERFLPGGAFFPRL